MDLQKGPRLACQARTRIAAIRHWSWCNPFGRLAEGPQQLIESDEFQYPSHGRAQRRLDLELLPARACALTRVEQDMHAAAVDEVKP